MLVCWIVVSRQDNDIPVTVTLFLLRGNMLLVIILFFVLRNYLRLSMSFTFLRNKPCYGETLRDGTETRSPVLLSKILADRIE